MTESVETLVIEDSEEDTFLLIHELSRQLSNIHHTRVDTLSDLNKALEKRWDIILCDFNLPEFDGLTALHIIREKGVDVPFILVSGVVEEGTAASMMRLGANDYIMKDNLKRLAPAVIRELGEAKLRKELRAAVKTAGLVPDGNSENGGAAKGDSPAGRNNAGTLDDANEKHAEILTFIENTRKQAGEGNFIKERHKAVVNILFVAGLIKKHQDKILDREGLTDQQFNILRILKRHHPNNVSMNQLREEILSKTTDVSRLIERMAMLEMVHYAKSDKDKRFRNISITAEGLKMLDNMNKCAEEMFFTERQIPEQDARVINEKMKCILDQIGE